MKMISPKTVRVSIHQEDDGTYWADSIDAVGCFTVGATIDETLRNMQEAVRLHLDIPDRHPLVLRPRFAANLTFA